LNEGPPQVEEAQGLVELAIENEFRVTGSPIEVARYSTEMLPG